MITPLYTEHNTTQTPKWMKTKKQAREMRKHEWKQKNTGIHIPNSNKTPIFVAQMETAIHNQIF